MSASPDRHILVLGDQLTREVGPLAHADPATTSVLMVESRAQAQAMRHHKQKLIMSYAAMRHFAQSLREDGFHVSYLEAEASFETGVGSYLEQHPNATFTLMQPNDYGLDTLLSRAASNHGGDVAVVPNALWLTDNNDFDDHAIDRKTLRMENFYRLMRTKTGYLMDDGKPTGGAWNLDKENRQPPAAGHRFPPPRPFTPDAITQRVIAYVEKTFPDHFGEAEPFCWPVTRAQALDALEDFCTHRLRTFGPLEDAMVQGEYTLYHSRLSILLNVGLLHPREVCETALAYYEDGRRNIPLNSIEGFIRQVLGWREFMHQVYRSKMPAIKRQNRLNQSLELPALYWSGETHMNCLSQVMTQLKETAYAHHIQRLMVLGNFALIAGVNPQQLTDWFTATHIDALDWVMVPNVIGMSQYADLGSFTSKPYAASANYINKMSNYCGGCHYRQNKTTGDDACPFNALYWDFLERNKETLGNNARMKLVLANWAKQDGAKKKGILERAHKVKRALQESAL